MSNPTPTDDAPPTGTVTPMQRILMDRARAHAERDRQKTPRSPLQIVGSIVLAIAAVLIVFGAINAFLAAMQRAMHQMDEQEKEQEAKREAEQRKAPIPAYVVPDETPRK